jgi:uncharacterized protein YjbI with pentapeptide repeats
LAEQSRNRALTFERALSALTTIAALATSIVAVMALFHARASLEATLNELRMSQQTQVAERYARAITQIGSSSSIVRMGGVYAIERLMSDSPGDQRVLVETLAGYVRAHTPPTEPAQPLSDRVRPAADVQAVLTVLGRRDTRHDKDVVVNLDEANIGAADLHGARLAHARLAKANLTRADLSMADLTGADLLGAQLGGVRLNGARLVDAHLDPANLTGADLSGADLTGADLSNKGLTRRGATREQIATIPSAGLASADLTRADLTNTNLAGVDLRTTTGLTTEQLRCVIIDKKTRLPRHIPRPTKRSATCPPL